VVITWLRIGVLARFFKAQTGRQLLRLARTGSRNTLPNRPLRGRDAIIWRMVEAVQRGAGVPIQKWWLMAMEAITASITMHGRTE